MIGFIRSLGIICKKKINLLALIHWGPPPKQGHLVSFTFKPGLEPGFPKCQSNTPLCFEV